jgi:hypothetical protein
MNSAVIYALHKKRSLPPSFLDLPKQPTTIGTTGAISASRSTWIRTSKTSKIRLLSYKFTSNVTGSAPSLPVASQSGLAQWRTPFVPLARRLRHWGPRTLG